MPLRQIGLFLVLFIFFVWSVTPVLAGPPAKVDAELWQELLKSSASGPATFFVQFQENTVLESERKSLEQSSLHQLRRESAHNLRKMRTRVSLGGHQLKNELYSLRAERVSAKDLKKFSTGTSKIKFKEYHHFNVLAAGVANNLEARRLVRRLAKRSDVKRIVKNSELSVPEPIQASPDSDPSASSFDPIQQQLSHGITYGLEMIRAPELWSLGLDGSGIVIANIDTGVDWNHPSLILQGQRKIARIGDGSLGWLDLNQNPSTGLPEVTPVDESGHGTHVLGTILGGELEWAVGQSVKIGVAPAARYYAVRVFGSLAATEAMFLEAADWLLDPDGNPQTNDQPHIVNNSWSRGSAGSSDPFLREKIQAWRMAGIVPIFSSGNQGALGKASTSAPGNYPESISVGAVDSEDRIAVKSSRGPAFYDGLNRIKPNIAAPGISVISARGVGTDVLIGTPDYQEGDNVLGVNSDLYLLGGTSMAAPHVSGLTALLLQNSPTESVLDIQCRLELSAVDLGSAGPDNSYGWGRVDGLAAINSVPAQSLVVHDLLIDDQLSGNGDGFLQADEEVYLRPFVHNRCLEIPFARLEIHLLSANSLVLRQQIEVSNLSENEERAIEVEEAFALQVASDALVGEKVIVQVQAFDELNQPLSSPQEFAFELRVPSSFSPTSFRTVADIDQDGRSEVIELYRESLTVYHAEDDRPLELPGWPQEVPRAAQVTPVVGNILPESPGVEVVMVTDAIAASSFIGNEVYIFSASGSVLRKLRLPSKDYSSPSEVPLGAYFFDSLAVADVDGDQVDEILLGGRKFISNGGSGMIRQVANILVLGSKGEIVANQWLSAIEDEESWGLSSLRTVHLAAADIDADGADEVVYSANTSLLMDKTNVSRVFAFRGDGTPLSGWETGKLSGLAGAGRPILADLDLDGNLEIAFRSIAEDELWVYRHDGSLLLNDDTSLHEGSSFSSLIAGDLERDGRVELVASSIAGPQLIQADGSFSDLPISSASRFGRASLADVTGDGIVDVLVANKSGELHVFSGKQISISSADSPWPIQLASENSSTRDLRAFTPTVGDFDDDRKLEILVGPYLVNLNTPFDNLLIQWGTRLGNHKGTHALSVRKFIRGDVNGSGSVDLTDAVLIFNHLFLGAGSEVISCPDAADANDDGVLNITDGQYILNHLFLEGPAPLAPYPASGYDLTIDQLGCSY